MGYCYIHQRAFFATIHMFLTVYHTIQIHLTLQHSPDAQPLDQDLVL